MCIPTPRNMTTDNKHAASFNAAPGTEDCSTSDEGIRAGEMEQIKRDLKSRHINMIAIAGLIVRVPTPNYECHHEANIQTR